MERTYNVFVDNGLFVLANYLNKDIKNINNQDITNQEVIKYFSDLFNKAYKTEKYRALAFASFQNSAYTQKDIDVNKKFNDILNQSVLDGDICTICGENKVPQYDNVFLSSLTKSMMPRLASNTFFNFSNNLKKQNICPTCLYLSMLSFFNIYPIGKQCILFNSDDDEFIYDYTYEHCNQIQKDIILNPKINTEVKYINEIEDVIEKTINKNKVYNGYVQFILFYNSSQSESYNSDILNKKDMEFIKVLQSISLLSEFKFNKLFYYLLKGQLQKNYLTYVFDYKENKLKISNELFDIIEERYSKMSKSKLELIKRICKQVNEKISKDMIKEIKGIDKLNQFEKLINTWIENIPKLMTLEEYDDLCNIKDFNSVKNRIYIELINLKNEGEI